MNYPLKQMSDFIQGMKDRMVVSTGKYGEPRADSGTDYIRSCMVRIRKYEEDGNTEWLIDAGNFLMLEFRFPSHENPSFRATNSEESPGLVMLDGTIQRRLV